MATLRVIFENGEPERTIEFDPARAPFHHDGTPGSILDVMLGHGIHLEHACGGNCACTTCHVIVRQGFAELAEASEQEEDLLDRAPGITREFLESHSPELQPEQIRGFDALLVLAPSVTAATLTGADRLALVSLCQPVLPSRSRQSPYACKSSRRIGSVRNRRPVA